VVATAHTRVVTGLNAEGKSVVTSAGPAPAIFEYEGWSMEEHWAIERMPPPLDETTNAAEQPEYLLQPSAGEARCRIVTFGPHSSFPMHTTATLDFLVVLSGELRMLMEEGDITLHAGDTVVQRGTPHGWANDTDQECVVAGILISADDLPEEPVA
jgi:quercetin dioxygenase-like cupin family protein